MSFDVIVIGAGAGGLAAAYKLAIAGRRILVIEKGPTLRPNQEAPGCSPVLSGCKHRSREPWRDVTGDIFLPDEFCNVGGKTKWYGGALLRMIPREFEPDPSYRALAWPLSYKEFSRHYEEAEAMFCPTNFDHEPFLRRIIKSVSANGRWTCESIAMALQKDILHDHYYLKHFDGYVSLKHYKRDAENVFLDRIVGTKNASIITGVEVIDFLHSDGAPNCITGVVCSDGTIWRSQAVIAAAGAMRSPLLLQRHLSRTGMAGSPLIGCFLKKHLISTVLMLSLMANTDVMRKTAGFFNDHYPHTTVQCLAWFDVQRLTRRLPKMIPGAAADWIAARCSLFFVMTEDGSHKCNAVTWTESGPPLVDYDARRLPKAGREHRQARRNFCWRLRRSGCFVLARSVGISGTAHAVGTLVAGDDPDKSVVDAAGKVHGMQGLYVADGSALPRSGRVNPALTIYAWGLRVGELLGASLDSEIVKHSRWRSA